MAVVSNSSPLIWLSKIGRIELLRSLYGEVVIPEEVYAEVVERGLEEGFSDALVIKGCVTQGWIRVSGLDDGEKELCRSIAEQAKEIHPGEAQAILLARGSGSMLLMDESSGRALAEAWGLRVRGTVHVVLRALREGLLSKGEAREAVTSMVERGFRIDPRLLTRLLREIEKVPSSKGNSSVIASGRL